MKKSIRILSVIALCAMMLLLTACGSGKKFSHGVIGAADYKSKYLGLKASFDPNRVVIMISEETLAMGNGVSDMSSENLRKALDKNGAITEMSVILTEADSVSITVHDHEAIGAQSEDEYLEAMKEHLAKEDIQAEITTVNFLGESVRCLEYGMTVLGDPLYSTLIPIDKGDYIAIIGFDSSSKERIKPLIDCFKAY